MAGLVAEHLSSIHKTQYCLRRESICAQAWACNPRLPRRQECLTALPSETLSQRTLNEDEEGTLAQDTAAVNP